MTRIAVANAKGGTAKTTTAMYLATVLADRGRGVRVIDADPQGDAWDWHTRAGEDGDPMPFPLTTVNERELQHLARETDEDGVWTILDVPPHGERMAAGIMAADFVVIPSSASRADLDQAVSTQQRCAQLGRPSAVLIVRAEQRTRAYRDAIAALDALETPRFDNCIPKRQDIQGAKATRPRGSALHEYRDVAGELAAVLDA